MEGIEVQSTPSADAEHDVGVRRPTFFADGGAHDVPEEVHPGVRFEFGEGDLKR